MDPLTLTLTGALVAATGAAVATTIGWLRARRVAAEATAEIAEAHRLVAERIELPSVFSHEVRTPLALIKGAGELLAEETPGPLNARQREFVTTISANAEQVIAMAESLLTEARLTSRLFTLNAHPVDIRSLVHDTVRGLRRIHDVPLRLDGQGAPLTVCGDAELLRQALWNLINNAVRHAGDDATVTVRVAAGDDDVIVSVTDDGAGMSPQEREHLFEPFTVGSTRRPGTGLGMMITREIVTLHGGRMLIDTIDEHGTTVFFTLPLHVPAPGERHG